MDTYHRRLPLATGAILVFYSWTSFKPQHHWLWKKLCAFHLESPLSRTLLPQSILIFSEFSASMDGCVAAVSPAEFALSCPELLLNPAVNHCTVSLAQLWCINQFVCKGHLDKAWTAGTHKLFMVASARNAFPLTCLCWITLQLKYICYNSGHHCIYLMKIQAKVIHSRGQVSTLLGSSEAVRMAPAGSWGL